MLPKKSRLPSDEFRAGKQKTITTPYFSLKTKTNQLEENRIGVVVGAAVHRSAVRRNFWKRQAKATLAEKLRDGKDLLLILFPKINSLTKKQFREKLNDAMHQASGIK